MNHRSIVFLSVLLVLPIVGFGCAKKTATGAASGSVNGYESLAYLPPPAPAESEDARNLRELREALTAFQNAKTFRAKLAVDTTDGKTTGQIDVMKPDRFHGTVDVSSGGQESEVIGIGTNMYVKQADGTWLQVESPPLAASLAKAFRSTVNTDSSIISASLPDTTVVTKSVNRTRSCDDYKTTVTGEDKTTTNLTVCVQNGLPKFIDATADQGYVSIEYVDYNTLFVIERPTVKK
jgi:hypothetical protein